MEIKNLFVLGIFLIGILALSGIASADTAPFAPVPFGATTLEITQVEVNDVNLDSTARKNIEKTDELEILVAFKLGADTEDVQITAELTGYDKKDKDLLEDASDAFDVNADEIYDERLNIELPVRMEISNYNLKITVDSKEDRMTLLFPVKIESPDELVAIRDVILSPSNGVIAGRALLATVRVQNRGDSKEEDVKVTFSIPELDIAASDYINKLDEDEGDDDSKSTEELYLRIPQCVDAGSYEAVVEVEFDDGDEVETKTMNVEVLADETCEIAGEEPTVEKTVISISSDAQDVTKGAPGVIYPVTITNAGKGSRTYTVSVTGGDWGSFSVKPTNVITVDKGETKSLYINAAADADAAAGTQVFGVEVSSADKTIEEVTLKANVVEPAGAAGFDLKRTLEVGLIVLVVILVILALVIGFNKLKGEEEEKEEGESYY